MAGVAAKLCLELGLHRERFFEDTRVPPQRIADWKRLVTCVYRLDRHCSFYSGLPWTLHDEEINVSALAVVWTPSADPSVCDYVHVTNRSSLSV